MREAEKKEKMGLIKRKGRSTNEEEQKRKWMKK